MALGLDPSGAAVEAVAVILEPESLPNIDSWAQIDMRWQEGEINKKGYEARAPNDWAVTQIHHTFPEKICPASYYSPVQLP